MLIRTRDLLKFVPFKNLAGEVHVYHVINSFLDNSKPGIDEPTVIGKRSWSSI